MTATTVKDRNALRIGRVTATYLVPRDHPAPARVRLQLDDVFRRDVVAACARRFGPFCDDADPSVWFVRRLAVDLSVNVAWTSDRLSEAWASEVTRSLRRRLRNGDDGEEVLRFPNRAVWLAQFLRDIADGVAWSKWYYESLNGLRTLPLSAALREAICREPHSGEAALRKLAENLRLGKILTAMSDADCRTVWRTFCAQDDRVEAETLSSDHLRTAARAWRNIRTFEPNYRATLELFCALPDAMQPERSALRQAIAALLALVRGVNSRQGRQFNRVLERGQMRSLVSLVGSEGVESLAGLFARDRAAVLEVARELRSGKIGRTLTVVDGETVTTFSAFGGIFFLLPRLVELDLEESAAALPEFEGEPPLALTRFLVMLKCLGGARAPHAFFDPVLRQVAGISTDLDAESVRVWARSVTREQAGEFQKRWAACCRRRGVVGNRFYSVHPVRRGKMLILSDCERGCWLRAERSVAALTEVLTARPAEELPEALLCDPSLVKNLQARIADIPMRAWNSPEVSEWAAQDAALATCLEHTHPPDDDLNYLSLSTLLRGTRHLDLTLSLAAREVLRAFAWRLPGFAWSSCEYLGTNFLDTNANIEAGWGGWLVRLTRPPLHVVLAMTGAAHDSYHLPWLDKLRIQLTTGES